MPPFCICITQWRRRDLVQQGHETNREQFKGDTQKYYGIHAINSDKTISLNIFYSIGNHKQSNDTRVSKCVQLWSDQKIKQLEVEEGRGHSQCPIAGDANGIPSLTRAGRQLERSKK